MRFIPEQTAAMTGKWLSAGLDVLLPPACALCDCDLGERAGGLSLCRQCRGELTVGTDGHCPRCAAIVSPAPSRCQACSGKRWSFDRVLALGPYRVALRSAVLRLKLPGQEPLAAVAAGLLWETRRDRLEGLGVDVVAPVPIHWTKRLLRGANSPETVAELLARNLRVAFEPRLVRCRRKTRPQRTLSRADRLTNVRGAFAVATGAQLDGARVLLVDDILTTGATCHEIGRALRRAGAAEVTVAVLARADEWV